MSTLSPQVKAALREDFRLVHRKHGRRVDTDFMNDLMQAVDSAFQPEIERLLRDAHSKELETIDDMMNFYGHDKWQEVYKLRRGQLMLTQPKHEEQNRG